jgi:hypothetical protein
LDQFKEVFGTVILEMVGLVVTRALTSLFHIRFPPHHGESVGERENLRCTKKMATPG